MDSAVTHIRDAVGAARARDTGMTKDTLTEERNQAERERHDLATKIETHGQEITELDRLLEQMTELRARKVKERADMMDAHSIKASSVAMLLDRSIRSRQS